MNSVISAIENTVSISLFNKGMAGKIFSDVKRTGAKVVIKNNSPECVLMSPEDYLAFMEEVQDAQLLSLANARLAHYDPASLVTMDEVNREFGIAEESLKEYDEVELE